MDMLGHDDDCVELISLTTVLATVLKNCVTRFGGEGRWDQLAERHEERPSGFLIVR